jgi:hypothetical protein
MRFIAYQRRPHLLSEVADKNAHVTAWRRCLATATTSTTFARGIESLLSLTRHKRARAFALPNHVAGEVKGLLRGVARVVDLVQRLIRKNRKIADLANIDPRSIAGTDRRGHDHRQSPVINALLDSQEQLALGQNRLGSHEGLSRYRGAPRLLRP